MDTEFVETELNGVKLRVFKDGTIMRYIAKSGNSHNIGWKICNTKPNNMGYYHIGLTNGLNTHRYLFHRIIAMVYLGLDITNKLISVDHIDRNTLNNNVNNLRIVTHQENMWNTSAKGYWFVKKVNKWRAKIMVNRIEFHLGYFTNEEEARNAYLKAKAKYHIISHHPNHHLLETKSDPNHQTTIDYLH
jgi:hypothetical protein